MFRYLIFSITLLSMFFFSACGGEYSTKTAPPVDLPSQKKTDKLNDALLLNAVSRQETPDEGYQIGPEDLLEIEASNIEELKKAVRVNHSGEISLPLVGILGVKGMTTSEVEQLLTRKLDKYVEYTEVTVSIKEYRSHRVAVIGAVKSPQTFSISGQKHLLDLLLMAGGLSGDAGNICYVIRPAAKAENETRPETIIIDLNELLINSNFSLNVPLSSGDIVNIPRGGVFFIDGEVTTPGPYTLTGKISLAQAISMAHGLTPDALKTELRIFRDNGKGEKDIILADYEAIRDGKKPDVMLVENDIIVVSRNGAKRFFDGFVSVLRGLVTLGTYTVLK